MGIRNALRPRETVGATVDRATAAFPIQSPGGPSTMPYASPWAGDSHLERMVFHDIFPDGLPTTTRLACMAIPAVSRARLMLFTAVSRSPLRVLTGDQVKAEQPEWLTSTARVMPRQRVGWTTDDHLFYGWSCHWTDRASNGELEHVERVNIGDWNVTPDLKLEVNGKVVSDEQAILIPGYHDGILNFGREAIADTKQLYAIVRDRLANPVAMTELHQVSGKALTKDERRDLVGSWREARNMPGGSVGYTSPEIELKTHGSDSDTTLLIEARNAAAVDMARLVGVSAGMLDATTPKASLTYETRTGRNQEFVDLDVLAYMNPIEDRYSMDDIVEPGDRCAFDRGDFTTPTPSPTGPALED